MARFLPILLLVLAASAGSALGEEDAPAPKPRPLAERTEEEVRKMVRAKGGLSSSWGAYYAGKYRLEGLVPELRALVARENERPENGTPLIRKAALDALVRLDADVPAALLQARPDEISLPETLILLARDPKANRDALLRLMDLPPIEGQHRWAAAVLLLQAPPPGLARHLLADVRLRLDVTVRDAGSRELILSGVGVGGGMWGGTGRIFPPRPTYSFHLRPERGDIVLGGGALSLYARRTEGHRRGRTEPKTREGRRSEIALRCLGVLLERDLQDDADFPAIGIDWTDEAGFVATVDGERSRVLAYWAGLVEGLRNRGLLLPDDEIPGDPPLQVRVHDRRAVKEPPLPE